MTANPQLTYQFFRYIVVGVINTLVTLLVIFICKSLLNINPWLSNAIGYVLGMVNSFLWNRQWVFKSHSTHVHTQALKFIVGFLVCYGLQFVTTWLLTHAMGNMLISFYYFTMSSYGLATLIGMVVYTVANFVFNRLVTFKSETSQV